MTNPVLFESHKAMLFEPSYDDAGFVRLWLQERRIEVVEWTRVGDAWTQRWKVSRPYINVVELLLPNKDGIYCAKRLKALDPDCKVLLTIPFSGRYMGEIAMKALGEGVDAVIPKPLSKERFLASLDYVLKLPGRKKAGAPAQAQ